MIELTQSQEQAIDKILDEMVNPSRGGIVSLVGGGGVGKTTSIFSLINILEREQGLKVLICAPTHKACNVLRETQVKFQNSTEVSTLASALGFRCLPEDGKKAFKVAGGNKLEGVHVVIVDEASQIGKTATKELIAQTLKNNITVVGLGDDCQTPPTKEFTSPMFNNGRLVELSEVIRYTGDVLVMATDLRKHIKEGSKVIYDIRKHIPKGSTDVIHHGTKESFIKRAIELVDPKDPDFCKILAWRNVEVQAYNRSVHEALHGTDAPEYLIGDIILPQAPVVSGKDILANTDDPCVILGLESGVSDLLSMGKVLIDTNLLTVRNIRTSEEFTFESVAVAHKELYSQAINEIATMCRAGEVHWSEFYRLDETLVDIRHPYASTVHKCQGSTYQHNFMDMRDILRCRQSYIANRLIYTGMTRANRLHLL